MFTFTDLLLTISFSIAPDWFTHLGKHGILRSTWRVWLVSPKQYRMLIRLIASTGWFFGDFFMEDFPASLEYTGIYR
jgi:phosphatidylethanolamine N-methyltransferase